RKYGAGDIDPETGEILTQEQRETASQSVQSQDAAVVSEYAGTSPDENPATDAAKGETMAGVASGQSPPSPAPACCPAETKTSEAVNPPTASLASPAGTKRTHSDYGSDPLNNAPSAEADQAGAIGGRPMSAVAPAAIPDSDVPAFLRAEQAGK